MTKDQAISIKVRLETAVMALREAYNHLPPLDEIEDGTPAETVRESIEDALSACDTALSMTNSVIGA